MGTTQTIAPGEFSFKPGAVVVVALSFTVRETVLDLTLIYHSVHVDFLYSYLDEDSVLEHTHQPLAVRHCYLSFDKVLSSELTLAGNLERCHRCSHHHLDAGRLDECSLSISCRDIVELV